MRVLGLDSGGTCGYALGECGGRPTFGIVRLPSKSSASKQFVIFEGRVRELIITGQIDRVYLELPFLMRDKEKLDINRERLAWGWQAVAGMACEKEGVLIFPVAAATWRSFFMGVTQAPPDCGRGLSKSAFTTVRRAWMKKRAYDEAVKRGWNPPETIGQDAAEAGGVWCYGCDHAVAGSTGDTTPLLPMLDL